MASTESTFAEHIPTKKETKKAIFDKFSGALEEYKDKIDPKVLEDKLKKATKLFAPDIRKALKKDLKLSSANGHENK